MFVLTVDQIGSRHRGDQVASLLASLTTAGPLAGVDPALPAGGTPAPGDGLLLAVERTVGDEIQVVLADPVLTVRVALDLLRRTQWSVGVGAGEADLPLPASARAASGPVFIAARAAVTAAKSRRRTVPLAVRGADEVAAADAQAVFTLVAAVVRRRSAAGWAVIDRRSRPGVRQEEIAADLGITQQAVSARMTAALWEEEQAAIPALARLLVAAGRMDSKGR